MEIKTRTSVRMLLAAVIAAWASCFCGVAAAQDAATASAPSDQEPYYLRKGDVVLWMGDQITEDSYFTLIFNEDLRRAHPELVLKDGQLPKDMKGPGIQFVNAGQAGETATAAIHRVDGLISKHRPTVAVLCYGMADRFRDRNRYRESLKVLTQKLKRAGVSVTIVSAPSVCIIKHPEMDKYLPVMKELSVEAKKVAEDEKVGFADAYAATEASAKEGRDFTQDGAHPNRRGQRMICDELQSAWGFGRPLAKDGQQRVRPWPSGPQAATAPSSQPAVQPKPAPGPGPKPDQTKIDLSARRQSWTNVTTNVGGEKWGKGGIVLMTAVPGSQDIIAGVGDGGLWISYDGGAGWRQLGVVGKTQITGQASHVLFDPKEPKTFWAATVGGGLYKTTDAGRRFEAMGTMASCGGIGIDFVDLDRKTLVVGVEGKSCNVQKSADGGKTWSNIGAALPVRTNFSSQAVLLDEKTYLVGVAGAGLGEFGIYRSEDGGRMWKCVSSGGPVGQPLKSADGSLYWAQLWGKGLLKSSDNGKTWKALEGQVKVTPIDITADRLLAFDDRQMLVSPDGGKTWKNFGPPMPFKPSGIVFSDTRKSIYIWKSTGELKADDAIYRLDLPDDFKRSVQ